LGLVVVCVLAGQWRRKARSPEKQAAGSDDDAFVCFSVY